jgi:hypothetical protein
VDGKIRVWDLAARKEVSGFGGAPGRTVSAAVSPDGKVLATGEQDGTIRTWDVAAGKERHRWQGHEGLGVPGTGTVLALAFSPDGATLASGGGDFSVRLWDAARAKELARFEEHSGPVHSVAFSSSGRVLASGSWDGTVRLWEVATRQERRHFEGHRGWVQRVTFAADGKTVASAGADTTVLLWDATGRPPPGRPAPRPSAEELKTLWTKLAGADAGEAFTAIGTLAAAPAQAVPLLENGLRPVPPADPKRLARLLADLDSEAFETRDGAARELEQLGDAAEPYLRRALEGKPTAEARRAAELLLEGLEGRTERVRAGRALEVLEYADTPGAKKLLRALAKGAPEAWLTRQATAALGRLEKPPAK